MGVEWGYNDGNVMQFLMMEMMILTRRWTGVINDLIDLNAPNILWFKVCRLYVAVLAHHSHRTQTWSWFLGRLKRHQQCHQHLLSALPGFAERHSAKPVQAQIFEGQTLGVSQKLPAACHFPMDLTFQADPQAQLHQLWSCGHPVSFNML